MSASTRQKFKDTYITPIQVSKDGTNIGRSGILGSIGVYAIPSFTYDFGQTCLRGTGYDTTPSQIRTWVGGGNISAVATLTAEGDSVAVHPAGDNEGAVLSFSLVSGELVPSKSTAQTLLANGCEPASGLAVNRDESSADTVHQPGFHAVLHPGIN